MKKLKKTIAALTATAFLALSAPAMAFAADNNTFPTAQVLEPGSGVDGAITVDDSVDYYKVTLTESGKLDFSIDGTMKATYVSLFQGASQDTSIFKDDYVSYDSALGTTTESYSYDLVAGEYYIRVSKGYLSGESNYAGTYKLHTSFTSANESFAETVDSNNNTILNASAVELGKTYNGQIAYNDDVDYYKIDLPSSGYLEINTDGSLYECYMEFFDADLNRIFYDYVSQNSAVQSLSSNNSIRLTKGTYYLMVKKYSSYKGNYSISTKFTSANESFEETGNGINNNILAASSVEFGKDYKGQIAYNDNSDFYSFELAKSGCVTLDFDSPIGYVYIRLYDSENDRLINEYYSLNNTTDKIILKKDIHLTAGKYIMSVEKYGDNYTGTYNFKLNYTSANESFSESGNGSNNIIDDASAIEINKKYTGQIALNDKKDFYKFTVNQAGPVTINYAGTIEKADLYIYNADGKSVDSSYGASGNLNIKKTLSAGTYYFAACYDDYTYKYGTYDFSISVPETSLGDINDDGNVDAVDASYVLTAYAQAAVSGGNNGLTASEVTAADVNEDTNVDAVDASFILSYYAYTATGGSGTMVEYMEKNG